MMLKRKLIVLLLALAMAAVSLATVSTNPGRNEYTAIAAQTVFNYTFKIYADTDLSVYQTPVGQEPDDSVDLTTAYTVTGAGDDAGGSITLNSGTTAGDLITIVSSIPTNRTIDYQFNGDFRPDVVNNDFDRAVSLVKQLENTSVNTLAYQDSFQGGAGVLPDPVASNVIGYDGLGQLTNLVLGVDGNSWDGLADLGDNSIGKGSDLVAHTGTADTVTEALAKKVDVAGDTMTGGLNLNNGTAATPKVLFEDDVNDSAFGIDLVNEVARFTTDYQGAGGQDAVTIDVQTGLMSNLSNRVLTTADEGTGNGLDADTVDGQHAAEFTTLGSRAWVNFDGADVGTGNPHTINDSANVTSLIDNGTGLFTLNLSVTMANTGWVYSTSCEEQAVGVDQGAMVNLVAGTKTTTAAQFRVRNGAGVAIDGVGDISITVFGTLAP